MRRANACATRRNLHSTTSSTKQPQRRCNVLDRQIDAHDRPKTHFTKNERRGVRGPPRNAAVATRAHQPRPRGARRPRPRPDRTANAKPSRGIHGRAAASTLPLNQARAPTTLRANLRRTSHSHYISDVPPPPKPRRRRRLRRRAARPRSRYHRSSRRTRSGQPVAQGVGLGRREVAPHASEAATPPSETSRRTPPARRTVAASVVQTKGRITDLKMEDILSYARVGEPTRRLHGLV